MANKSAASTPPPPVTVAGKDSPNSGPKVNGTSEKAEKEKPKRKEKKKERAERAEGGVSTPDNSTSPSVPPESSTAPELSAAGTPDTGPKVELDEFKSPADSNGQRTPKTGKPPRHPWTIFMRMGAHLQVTENEIREFYGEAKDGVS